MFTFANIIVNPNVNIMNLLSNIENIEISRLNAFSYRVMIDYSNCSLEVEFEATIFAKYGFSNHIDSSETDDHDTIEVHNIKANPKCNLYTEDDKSILVLDDKSINMIEMIIENEIINSDVAKYIAA